MAPRGRFELPTFRLTAERSTIELPGNGKQTLNLQYFAWVDHRVWAFREMQVAILWIRYSMDEDTDTCGKLFSIAALGFINTWMLRCGCSLAFREFFA